MLRNLTKTSALIGMALGASIAAVSGAWSVVDYLALIEANNLVQSEALKSPPSRAEYLYNREMTHRINVFAEGVWFIGGCLLYVNSLALLNKSNN